MRTLPRLSPLPVLDGDIKPLLRPEQAQAELYGCPGKYLYFVEQDYRTPESYKIHNFKNLQIKHLNEQVETVDAKTQYDNVPKVLETLFTDRGQLIVINSHPGLEEGLQFLWHLACHAGVERLKDPIKRKSFSFSFVGNMRIENDEAYQVQSRHVIGYGPCLDEFDKERITNAVEFLVRFTDYTRILLLSTAGVSELLQKLRVVPASVAYFFNFYQKEEKKVGRGRKKVVEV